MQSRIEISKRLHVVRDAGIGATGELLDQAIAYIDADLDAGGKRQLRDGLIRRAALMLDAQSPYAKAGVLAIEAKALARRREFAQDDSPAGSPVRALLREAGRFGELPASRRHYYRVLVRGDD